MLSICLLLSLAGCVHAQSTALYTMQWQDQFSASSVDTSTWNFRLDAKAESAQLSANVQETGGDMIINLKQQQAEGFNYTGGGLVSKPNFHYGYFESRIKMNYGQGWHSSFWLMAGDGSSTFNTASHTHTEIDIFERDSTYNTSIASNINLWEANGSRNTSYGSGTLSTAYDFTQWNVFGAYWLENFILVFINGNQFANLSLTPQRWAHDYVNIWLTSIAYGVPPNNAALPSQVDFDYVSYSQKDYYLTSGTLCFANDQGSTPCASNVGYSETFSSWATSTLFGYTMGLTTRYSCNTAGASATWGLPSVAAAGTYQVWAWQMGQTNSDTQSSYKITKNSATVATVQVNQTSGGAGWVLLSGGVTVSAGDSWSVTVTGSGHGCVRADTVKFVRIA